MTIVFYNALQMKLCLKENYHESLNVAVTDSSTCILDSPWTTLSVEYLEIKIEQFEYGFKVFAQK